MRGLMGKILALPTSYVCRLISVVVVGLSVILSACTAEIDTKQPSTSKKLPNSMSPPDVADETNVTNNLAATYRVTQSSTLLVVADSIACQADGEASERISMAVVKMYNIDEKQFYRIVYAKKLRCLEQALVTGLSENLVILKGIERNKALAQLHLSVEAIAEKLTEQERTNAKAIISQVNPALFD